MAIRLISIEQLLDKSLFAAKGHNINVRSGSGTWSKVLLTIPAGRRIGKVQSWAKGRDSKGNRDGSMWLQLYERHGNKTGGAWVKLMPKIFSWKAFRKQGGKTVDEEIKEKEKAEKAASKTWRDDFKDIALILGIAWVASGATKPRTARR